MKLYERLGEERMRVYMNMGDIIAATHDGQCSQIPYSPTAQMKAVKENDSDVILELYSSDGSMNNAKLDAIIITPRCNINWWEILACLKTSNSTDVAIKVLKFHVAAQTVYVAEEYRMENDGWYCLKWNATHPSVRDKERVDDVW